MSAGRTKRLFTGPLLAVWFKTYAELEPDEDDYLKAVHLAEYGYDITDIPGRLYDVTIYHCSAVDYAEEVATECYDIPEQLQCYIDYEAIARDMTLNGEFSTLETANGDVLVFGL